MKINDEAILLLLKSMKNNLSVDILLKIFNSRIDKKGQIFFHQTFLKLGGSQFG